jgi:hypothetical protein
LSQNRCSNACTPSLTLRERAGGTCFASAESPSGLASACIRRGRAFRRAIASFSAACALFFFSGCLAFPSDERLFIESDPPGALIHIDGRSTGQVTPCVLAITDDAEVELALQGYPNETRRVKRVTHFRPSQRAHGGVSTLGSALPTDWIMEDWIFPLKWYTRNEPTRIHVVFRTTDS